MSTITTTRTTDTHPLTTTLGTDLLRQVYADRVQSIEVSPADRPVSPPDALPAIRIRPKGQDRIETASGHHFGEALVYAYSEASRPFTVSLHDFVSGTGVVHDRYASQPLGDIRAIDAERPPTLSALPGDVTAQASHWRIAHVIPLLPIHPEGAPLSYAVSTFANSVAVSIARPYPIGKRPAPRLRAVLLGHALHNDVPPLPSEADIGDPVKVRELSVSLRVHPVNGSCPWAQAEAHAAAAIDGYHGRAVDGLGRVSLVTIESSTRSDAGMQLDVSFRLAYQPRGAQ